MPCLELENVLRFSRAVCYAEGQSALAQPAIATPCDAQMVCDGAVRRIQIQNSFGVRRCFSSA